MKTVVQCKFEHYDGLIVTTQVAWVDESWHLKVGNMVNFKDDLRHWKVVEVYGTIIQPVHEINRTWHVGGL